MAQRPTFPSPYLNAIDATINNDFVCLINDRDVITDYVFTIQKYIKTTDENNVTTTTFEEVYKYPEENSNVVIEPIYGGRGNDSYLIVTVPANTLENNAEYKWKVSLTDSLNSTVESKEYYFTCVAKPTLNITSQSIVNGVLNTANATFVGEYNCTSPLIYHRFILLKDNEVIKDTGEIYSQYLSFEYDMFIYGKYSLVLQAENEGKMKSETSIDFVVDYMNVITNITPECYVSHNENSVIVDYSGVMTIPGTYVPNTKEYHQIDISETLKGVCIPQDTELCWEQRVGVSSGLNIDEADFTIQLMVNLPYGKRGKIIEISGDNTISILFDGVNINYEYSNGIAGHISVGNNRYISANIPKTQNINNDNIYIFNFDNTEEYYFIEEYQFVLQNPINMHWWLLTIKPDGVVATKGVEVIV